MIVWGNAHPGFLAGLALLFAIVLLGITDEVWRKMKSPRAVEDAHDAAAQLPCIRDIQFRFFMPDD